MVIFIILVAAFIMLNIEDYRVNPRNCFESDSGLDIYNAGTMAAPNDLVFRDSCIDDNTLQEYYCDSNYRIARIMVECNNGCFQGVCIKDEKEQPQITGFIVKEFNECLI